VVEAILWSRVECRTQSKTLLKSSAMTTTYELHDNISVTDWRMAMRALQSWIQSGGRHIDP